MCERALAWGERSGSSYHVWHDAEALEGPEPAAGAPVAALDLRESGEGGAWEHSARVCGVGMVGCELCGVSCGVKSCVICGVVGDDAWSVLCVVCMRGVLRRLRVWCVLCGVWCVAWCVACAMCLRSVGVRGVGGVLIWRVCRVYVVCVWCDVM